MHTWEYHITQFSYRNCRSERRIETAEVRFVRHVPGCTGRDEISNLAIHSELQIFIINDRIKDKKKELLDHIQRLDPYRIARKAVEYKPIEHRDRGHPKRRWEDDF
jgi:hypothetical protein